MLLEEKQIDSDHIDKISLPIKPKDAGVWMKNVFATWDTRNQEPTLGDLNFEINSGELLVIIGIAWDNFSITYIKLFLFLYTSKNVVFK